MRDVAARAGVSLKTVSRVLNGEAVREATAAKVEEAITALGFRRNDAAAHLRRSDQATRSIGLVIEDVTNPFFALITKAVEDALRPHGYLLIAASSETSVATERKVLETFFTRRVDGILVVPAGEEYGFLAREQSQGTPIVSLDRPTPGLSADAVTAANSEGVRSGVAHLAKHGHRRIGFVGDVSAFTGAERYDGYTQELKAQGIALDKTLVRRAHDAEAAFAAVRGLLEMDQPPTALFTGNNVLTFGALHALGDCRHSIALVAFDDFELADLLDPPVTVVHQDAAGLAATATGLLLERLGGYDGPARRVVLPTKLIERGSGELEPSRGER